MNLFKYTVNNDFDFIMEQVGREVKINSDKVTAIIQNISLNNSNKHDTKSIMTKAELRTGDLVEYNSFKWLIVNDINDKRYDHYNKSKMRKCPFVIKFNFKGDIVEVPAIVGVGMQGVEDGKVMTLPKGFLKVTMQDNEDTARIKEDLRFITMGYVWKVVSCTKEDKGLLYVYAEKDLVTHNDDLENEIADKWKHEEQESNDTGDTHTTEQQIEVIIKGDSKLYEYDENIYEAKLLKNDVEQIAQFDFTIDYNGCDERIAKLEVISDTECKLIANEDMIYGTIQLIAVDTSDNNNKCIQEIKVVG
ncbi:hypothetical protein [Clostridium ganghwense]|uniref:Uncharacterized protein n=1 Tax=Clostridium ganghwense TaxID=312089 RepID=A0ABT4CUL8_9CLOT|nr:hypothetical protein [Clostridium ganghwense]MCY6372769.1 hypothetical protein [Clostridium ganghwense]